MKLSKPQIKSHNEAVKILEKETLSFEEKEFVLNNWYPAYNNQIGIAGTFFTPLELVKDFTIEMFGTKIIDICAGIGALSFYYYYNNTHLEKKPQITCIEYNPQFVEVGKKILPEATWVLGDMRDEKLIKSLGRFNLAIGNPPFGKIKSNESAAWLSYTGADAEYQCIEIGSFLASNGVFIIPQMSASFKMSGTNYQPQTSQKLEKFTKQTGIQIEANCGLDTSHANDLWKGASPTVEIVTVEYAEKKQPQPSLF